MNNFASIFEELSKLYEEDVREVEPVEDEKVEEACTEELTEATEDEVVEDEFVEDEIPAEEAANEEPVVEEEPRRLIIECDKCGALVIKDEADVVIDEETDLVNVEDECQFCEEANGYKIIGVVAPYDVVDEEVVAEEEAPVEEALQETLSEEQVENFKKKISEIDEQIDYYNNQLKLAKEPSDIQDLERKLDGFHNNRNYYVNLIKNSGLKLDDLELELEEKPE